MIFYAVAAGLFFILKLFFAFFAENEHFNFILVPVSFIVEIFTGTSYVSVPESNGLYFGELNILIDRSCSGYNFLLLCFIMLAFLCLRFFPKPVHKLFVILIALFFAYCVTIFVNAARIIVSLVVQNTFSNFWPQQYSSLLHEACGIVVYLGFLIIIYMVSEKILSSRVHHNEKSA